MSKKTVTKWGKALEIHQSQLWMDFPASFPSQIIILGYQNTQRGINNFGKGDKSLQGAFLPPQGDRARVGRGLLPHYNTSQEEPTGEAGSGQGCCAETGGALSNQTSWRGWCLEIKSDCLFSNAPRGAWGGRRREGAGRRKQLELLALGFPSSSTVSWDLPPLLVVAERWMEVPAELFSSFSRLSWGKSRDLAGANLAFLLLSPEEPFLPQIWHWVTPHCGFQAPG